MKSYNKLINFLRRHCYDDTCSAYKIWYTHYRYKMSPKEYELKCCASQFKSVSDAFNAPSCAYTRRHNIRVMRSLWDYQHLCSSHDRYEWHWYEGQHKEIYILFTLIIGSLNNTGFRIRVWTKDYNDGKCKDGSWAKFIVAEAELKDSKILEESIIIMYFNDRSQIIYKYNNKNLFIINNKTSKKVIDVIINLHRGLLYGDSNRVKRNLKRLKDKDYNFEGYYRVIEGIDSGWGTYKTKKDAYDMVNNKDYERRELYYEFTEGRM